VIAGESKLDVTPVARSGAAIEHLCYLLFGE
jgi:hypothetical protein